MPSLAPAYRPRRPTETALYRIVREHLETFLAYARESYAAPLPRYVEQELRAYLRCGVFAHGFVRAHCDACGHDLLVAFSCKGRGVCPSCAGRRMCDTAARLVDRVLPAVPVRQWVLSLPFDLRAAAAFRPGVLTALLRIFVDAVFKRYRARAKRDDAIEDPQCGAVTFVQRFGSSVNLHVHFHVALLDGVFDRDEKGRLRFHDAPEPTRGEMEAIVRRVHARAGAWIARQRGKDEGRAATDHALDACAAIAMRRGTFDKTSDPAPRDEGAAQADDPPDVRDAVDFEGFNLNASVRIAASDDMGRERLCRYGARPPIALDRVRILPGGRVAYRIKRLAGARSKVRVMTPVEFLARLAALIPPPRYPLLRYHGVLAPASAWRPLVVPKPRDPPARACKPRNESPRGHSREPQHAAAPPQPERDRTPHRSSPAQPEATTLPLPLEGPPSLLPTAARMLAPNVLSVPHWTRLLGGTLLAPPGRIDWAQLLRRTFAVDVLECPTCRGRLRVVGFHRDPADATEILRRLDLPSEAPVAARARDPTDLLGEQPAD